MFKESTRPDCVKNFISMNATFSQREQDHGRVLLHMSVDKGDFNAEISTLLYDYGKKMFKPISGAVYSDATESLNFQISCDKHNVYEMRERMINMSTKVISQFAAKLVKENKQELLGGIDKKTAKRSFLNKIRTFGEGLTA